MKIVELHLLAFGGFSDKRLHFGAGNHGLNIVFGPNEAGKTTALNALTYLLYGIPGQTTYNFLHENSKLRIAGLLRHSSGEELYLRRRKGNKDTLLDAENAPLNDAVLDLYLAGVDKDQFRRVFGIDNQGLAEGGMTILGGKGDIGESLYAASMGIAGLSGVLTQLGDEAGGLFKSSGSKPLINATLKQFKETKKRIREESLMVSDWSELEKRHEQAVLERIESEKEVGRLSKEKIRLDGISSALPRIVERKSLLEQLSKLGELVMLPDDFTERRKTAVSNQKVGEKSNLKAKGDIAHLTNRIDELEASEGILEQSYAISELFQELAKFRQAIKDRPILMSEIERLRRAAKDELREIDPTLSLTDHDSLQISDSHKNRIRRLSKSRELVYSELTRWQKETVTTKEELDEIRGGLAELPEAKDSSDLKRAADKIDRKGPLELNVKTLNEEIATEKQQADIELESLSGWTGSLNYLERCEVPSTETVERFEEEFRHILRESRLLEEAIESKKKELDKIANSLKEEQIHQVPGETDLSEAREKRERGWAFIKRVWLDGEEVDTGQYSGEQPLHMVYETSVKSADEVADRLRWESDRVAKKDQLEDRQRAAADEITKLKEKLKSTGERIEQGQSNWQSLWAIAEIDALPPKEMRAWLLQRQSLLDRGKTLRGLNSELVATDSEISRCKDDLSMALLSLHNENPPKDESLVALLIRSVSEIETIEVTERRLLLLEDQQQKLEKTQKTGDRSSGEATLALKSWEKDWSEAIRPLYLAADSLPEDAEAAISSLELLFGSMREADSLENRITEIAVFTKSFESRADGLRSLVPDLADKEPQEIVASLHSFLAKAQKDAATLKELQEQVEAQELILHESGIDLEASSRELADLCATADCTEPSELEEIEGRNAHKLSLMDRLRQIDENLIEIRRGLSVEQLIAEAEKVDGDKIPGLLDELSRQHDEWEHKLLTLSEEIGGIDQRMREVGGGNDTAIAAAEEANSVLANLRDHVDHYRRVKLAEVLLRREIERYRAEHQGPLLGRASSLFEKLTLGSFRSLEPNYDAADNPVILGQRPSGDTVSVDGMSDGTRDQLYLALRLASLELYLDTNEPMPFIVDDILIKFDDERSKVTLDVLAQLSRKTQVIFFTHHERLAEMAREFSSTSNVSVDSLET